MKQEKVLSLLKLFIQIAIFQINAEGEVIKTVINTKEGFDDSLISDIQDIFCMDDRGIVERHFRSRSDKAKKHLRLASKFKVKEFVDVEFKTFETETYMSLSFVGMEIATNTTYNREIEEYAQLAELDPLTGLLNRYGYWERVKNMINCGDCDRRLGILFIDIDHLKEINDQKGHKVGDKAILQISNLILSNVRKRDVAVRYGGDEFIVVVEEMSGKKSTAYGLAKRLLKLINSKENNFLTTITIGVHVVRVGDLEEYAKNEKKLRKAWDGHIEIADRMAYKAKESGRNRVTFSGSEI